MLAGCWQQKRSGWVLVGSDPLATEEPEAPETFALPSIGSVIDDRYRIIRSIGAGGMGAVFEAEQLAVGRRCALKFLRTELAGRSRSAARFRREARLLGKLEHEHLTAVLDYGTYLGKSPFLVMEYLEGRTLKQVFEEQAPMPLDAALEVLIQVASGMAYVHRQHVVHRDLKPSNLMLIERSDGRPWLKILDFGIARALQEMDGHLTPSGAELGTAHYMSPEQARGTKDVDPRSDVYALGAILYEALTGARVHPGDSYNAIIFHLLTQPHRPLKELLPTCHEDLHAIVERCLEKDPQRRYADAGELADELVGLGRQTVDTSSAHGSAPRARRAVAARLLRRVSWLASGAVLGAVVTAAIGAIVLGEPAPRAGGSSESAAAGSAWVHAEHYTSTQASLLAREAPASAPLVARPASGAGVAQPVDAERPAPDTSRADPAPAALANGAEPGANTRRAPERASVSAKGSTSSALAARAPDESPLPSPAASTNTEGAEFSAGSAPTPALDDSVPAPDSFPFVTSNPYGAN